MSIATYRVWAAKKNEKPKIEVEVKAFSETVAIIDVMSRPEVIAEFGGALPLFGAELVYRAGNLPLLVNRFRNTVKAV